VSDRGTMAPAGFDPLRPSVQQQPYPWYAMLRRDAPVCPVPDRGLWFVTSRSLVVEATERPTLFSSRFGQPQNPPAPDVAQRVAEIMALGWPRVPTILTEDPPAHTFYRRMAGQAFGPRYVRRWEPHVQALCAELVDDVINRATADFVRDFAVPLPLRVIARSLSVPQDRIGDLHRWSVAVSSPIGAVTEADVALEQARQTVEFQHYFAELLTARKAEPRDDLLSTLVTAPDADRPLTIAEGLSVITQLLVAGNETTTRLLSGVLLELARNPGHWNWLREDPDARAGLVVEEALRFLSPVQGMFRVVTEATGLGGAILPAGAKVVLCYASANRDETTFDDADTFDPTRPDVARHLAFGHGAHYCLGAPLARLEASTALRELARRVRSITLAADNDLRYDPSFLLRGLTRLNLHVVGDDTPLE